MIDHAFLIFEIFAGAMALADVYFLLTKGSREVVAAFDVAQIMKPTIFSMHVARLDL